eukprot:759321-Hanusia_phi.AAC.1
MSGNDAKDGKEYRNHRSDGKHNRRSSFLFFEWTIKRVAVCECKHRTCELCRGTEYEAHGGLNWLTKADLSTISTEGAKSAEPTENGSCEVMLRFSKQYHAVGEKYLCHHNSAMFHPTRIYNFYTLIRI